MTSRITHSPSVEIDLDRLSDYFAVKDIDLAIRFSDAVADTEQALLKMPEMGALREYKALGLTGMRMILVNGFRNYMIFYMPTDYGIHVVRVLHGARDLEALFE
ncbi:MAG: plasmid stabilization system [Alphaproteobacteria bacterium]|nr:MAG: plasmid stabilization system [Alphaproteobacteria bacterium]